MHDRDMLEPKSLDQAQIPGAETMALLADIRHRENATVLKAGAEKLASVLTSDPQMQEEIAHYAAAGLKTAALFLRGRVGLAASVGLFALDEANPYDSPGQMLRESGLGALKGGASKFMFDKIGQTNWNPAVKAVGLGVGSRVTDAMFRSETYNNELGEFAPAAGIRHAFKSGFDTKSLGTDLATLGLSYALYRGVDRLTGSALSTNKLASTAFLGGSFGIVSGAHSELQNQIEDGMGIDFTKVALRGAAMGAVDAVASLPAGFQALSRMAPPKQWEASRMQHVRTEAKAHDLWLMEAPKPIFAADGTPVVAPLRGNMETAFTSASKLAAKLEHPVTLDWNSVRFRVEPGATMQQMREAHQQAHDDPARIAEVKRQHELFERRSRDEMTLAEREIDALRGKPAREPEVLMRDLTSKAPTNWAEHAMSTLRHPSEIDAFARAYVRFSPDSGLQNLKGASRFSQNGTEKIWEEVTKRIERSGSGQPNAGESKLFADIRAFETMNAKAQEHDLVLREARGNRIVVMPTGPKSIGEAGAATGRFAAALNRNVTLQFNEKFLEVKPNASGAEIEAAYFRK